jgi:hypothetical protein
MKLKGFCEAAETSLLQTLQENAQSKDRAAMATIERAEWVRETRGKLIDREAVFDAYQDLETFIVEHNLLNCTYRRANKGNSHFATFNGSARGHCSVIQIYNGQCQLIWRWLKPIPGISTDQHTAINEAFDCFRNSLSGSKTKGYEQAKVLAIGTDRIKNAIQRLSVRLNEIFDGVA